MAARAKNKFLAKRFARAIRGHYRDFGHAYVYWIWLRGSAGYVRRNLRLDLAGKLGIVEAIPRKTSIQRNRSNTPSSSPLDLYKKSVAIPLIDSLIIQMQGGPPRPSLAFLVPSIIVNNTLELSEATEGMLFWENDLPFLKSLGNELRRWQTMWQSAQKELPSDLLLALGACDMDAFPNIHRLLLIACTLPISSAEAERSSSLTRKGSKPAPDRRCLKSSFQMSLSLLCITLRDSG